MYGYKVHFRIKDKYELLSDTFARLAVAYEYADRLVKSGKYNVYFIEHLASGHKYEINEDEPK